MRAVESTYFLMLFDDKSGGNIAGVEAYLRAIEASVGPEDKDEIRQAREEVESAHHRLKKLQRRGLDG